MFIVKADHPDVPFTINPPSVVDSEGNPVDPGSLRYVLSTDNAGVVSLSLNDDGMSGSAHFGAPGFANVNVVVEPAAGGDMLGSFGAQFTVTAGDPAAIVGGSIAFEGITEA